MRQPTAPGYAAFAGKDYVASGDIRTVALAARAALRARPERPVSIFDDDTGRIVDLDLTGTPDDVLDRVSAAIHEDEGEVAPLAAKRGPGRPRLGVISKEVTLLPRHWAWLRAQRGSASATLRRLIDEARRTHERRDAVRRAQDSAYRFMSATVGYEPSFEEAIRALYRCDGSRFEAETQSFPPDLRDHCRKLAADAFHEPDTESSLTPPQR